MAQSLSESIEARNLLNQVFRSYNDILVRYLTLRTRSLQEAMEIAQEAYVRFLSMAEPEKILDIEAYVFGIAKNIHIDRVRSSRTGAKAIARGGHGLAYGGASSEASCAGPEDEAAAKDTVKQLKRAIEGLPPKCRQAFVLYKFELLGYPEIAERMGLTESMVRKYVLRALRECRQTLGLHAQEIS